MIFKGDLRQFHPMDALMFLSHLDINGMLSVKLEDKLLSLSFKDGFLVDAYSQIGDDKILRTIIFRKLISEDQFKRVLQIKHETGMPVRQILDNLNYFPLSRIKEVLESSIKEVLLEFFLLENGQFQFTDVLVDTDGAQTSFTVQNIALEITSQSDEWRDFETSNISLDRGLEIIKLPKKDKDVLDIEKMILRLVEKNVSIRQVLQQLPAASYTGLKAMERFLSDGTCKLAPLKTEEINHGVISDSDRLFFAFRRAFKSLVSTEDTFEKLRVMLSFCKDYFNNILILKVRETQIFEYILFTIDKKEGIQKKTIRKSLGKIDQELVFHAVDQSGVGFFGKVFPSKIISEIMPLFETGECAVIPVDNKSKLSLLVYVSTKKAAGDSNPLHYLELLSWLVSPSKEETGAHLNQPPPALKDVAAGCVSDNDARLTMPPNNIDDLVNKIEELPPLPSVASQIIRLLSDPNSSPEELETLIGQDQALVAKLIKVSNSVLFAGYQKIASLQRALTRLGVRTVKNLVLVASAHNFFPQNNSRIGIWSQILWHHSVECGMAARRIAMRVGYNDPEEAFVGGVVHDIGKLVIMLKLSDKFQQIQKLKEKNNLADIEIEKQVIGYDHQAIGEILLKKWNMPATIQTCVRYHHNGHTEGQSHTIALIVGYGNYLSHRHGFHAKPGLSDCDTDNPPHLQLLKITPEINADIIENVKTDFQNTGLFK
ncbi:MAG: HDOD domain-containing protein [Deltaproteobacteria bacterium]|nr:HDOD domain-containing protein [Deltaproteobacteria bacterium]